jgi:hypothetical protein
MQTKMRRDAGRKHTSLAAKEGERPLEMGK